MSEAKPNVASYVLDALAAEGASHLFLVPGTTVKQFLEWLPEDGGARRLRPIVAAHEAGAAFMADGFGRAARGFGVCMSIGGPGIANMIGALSGAHADRSRLLVVGGTVSTAGEGRGVFQDSSPSGIDDRALVRDVTVFAENVRSAAVARERYFPLRTGTGKG